MLYAISLLLLLLILIYFNEIIIVIIIIMKKGGVCEDRIESGVIDVTSDDKDIQIDGRTIVVSLF
jgi:hypothetical protein